jgi:ADP-heptose:LPS heptosyltransferase
MSTPELNVLVQGGLGDAILLTPSLRQWKLDHPGGKLTVNCPFDFQIEILKLNPHINELRKVAVSEGGVVTAANLGENIKVTDYGRFFRSQDTAKPPAQEQIATLLGVKLADLRPELHLSAGEVDEGFVLASRYVEPICFHPTPASSQNKAWFAESWMDLFAQMSASTFLQLGARSETLVPGAIDLRGMSLRNTFATILASRAFVGVDSVFAHAAVALSVPTVVLFGASNIQVWGHPSAKNLSAYLDCSPCLQTIGSTPCPIGRACMSMISPLAVANALEHEIQSNGKMM